MHRLYVKIFLWFWLGVIVVSVTLASMTALTHSRAEDDRRWREKYGPRVDLWARQEIDILRESGVAELRRYVGSFELDPGVSNYIFDAEGRELLNRQPPQPVLRTVREMGAELGERFDSDERIVADRVADSRGNRFTVVVDQPTPTMWSQPLLVFLFETADGSLDKGAVVRVVIVLGVAGLFCFWLAWQIVEPINRLRFTTRAIAHERLHVRVDKKVLARRDELADLGHDFDRMADRIETLVTAERRFLADVSHALRSPLARLNVALGLARREAPLETSQHLDRIERETERVNQLIGHLLTMARIDSGVDLERQASFDLGALAEEIGADADYEARSRKRTVKVDVGEGCTVNGAREMIRGAIENVVRNAVRHTAPDTAVEISVRPVPQASGAVINVRDHGSGVPPEAIERMFLAFHQVASQREQNPEGIGLGLAITKRTFELFGGSVSAANAADGGLLVTLRLPLC
jgi:signal transduction histidine kinase